VAFHGAALGNVSLSTILLVEDEALNRIDLAEYLRAAGFGNVLEAGNGDQALPMLGAHPNITLVISDVRMAGATMGWRLQDGCGPIGPM
jgi:two-component system, response regulator PdtaR